jgi:hypothetical protein
MKYEVKDTIRAIRAIRDPVSTPADEVCQSSITGDPVNSSKAMYYNHQRNPAQSTYPRKKKAG